jgi:hypothetical protein
MKRGFESCGYREDVEAMLYWAVHPRLNGCSSVCLLCGQSPSDDMDVMSALVHLEWCPARLAAERCKDQSLAAWIETQ